MTARKILFSAVKNEAPFLVEWIAYHRAIGFDRIIVVSNDSDDGTTELLDALDRAGAVRHIHHSVAPGESPQGRAAIAGNQSGLIEDGDWVIWLDADEFLNIHAGAGRVEDLIRQVGGATGMVIPWRLFGDGGQDGAGPWHFVSDRYCGAAGAEDKLNAQVKTFYRHGEGRTMLARKAPHRPALTRNAGFAAQDFLNPAGRPVDSTDKITRNWLSGVTAPGNAHAPAADFSWQIAQINHYSVRGPAVFRLKRLRGRGFVNPRVNVGIRHTDRFYATHNLNGVEDRSILRHESATQAQIAALLAMPGVAAAHDAALRLTAERIAALDDLTTEPVLSPEEPTPPALFTPAVSMPDSERALVESAYATHDVILEYGSGGSTVLAASQAHSLVMSVESDRAWADNLRAVIARDHPSAHVQVHWADIGPTGKWGRPVDESGWARFHRYPLAVWDQPWFRQPDLVLIDGRFRVGCLLATLLRSVRPVTVLFDDYADRPRYAAVVETFVKPVEIVGRMARFQITPGPLPPDRLTEIVAAMSRPD